MPSNLKDLIENNINANERLITRGRQKIRNQRVRESCLKKKLKKGLIYGTVCSTLALSIYGGNFCLNKYQDYVVQQEKKVDYYQKKFNNVKYYYNQKDYFKADDLSEKLQKEMSDEWFFSPTNGLYEKVKEYDNKFIDYEIKRIKREKFYTKLRTIPKNLFCKIEEIWDDFTQEEKVFVYLCGIGFAIYLLRKFRS